MSESPFEDRNSPLAKNKDSGPRPLSESSIERGDGYVIFSPEDPEVGGTRIILKWGGNPPEKNKQPDLKGGGGKGKDKGEEEDGESEGGSGEGKEKGGEGGKSQGGEEQGGEKEDKGKDKDGEAGGESELGDLDKILDKISGQDILGGGRNRGESDEDEDGDSPRRPPHGPHERGKGKDKEGKDKDKSSKDKSGKPIDPGSDDSVVEISSDITDVPPPSEEEDLSFLDVIFDKD
jgi:hypothetical protein